MPASDGAAGIDRGIELTPEHPIPRLVELGTEAEAAGFDAVVASCHYNNRDPFAALSRIAAETSSVWLGPGVANPYETHPVALASRVATLSELSGGRAIFGLGAGDRSTLANLGIERERPLSRVREAVTVSRRLLAGERVDHDGTFGARDAGLNYGVDQVPIYVGGQGPGMLRMAAACADGVLVNASHRLDVAWAAERIEEGRGERDADRGAPEVLAYASVSVAADAAAAREAARPPVAYIAAGAPQPVRDRHGIDTGRAGEIGSLIGAGDFSAAFDAVTDRMLDAFCVAGTPDTVGQRFATLLEHVDGIVAGSPLGPDPAVAMSHLAEAFDRADAT